MVRWDLSLCSAIRAAEHASKLARAAGWASQFSRPLAMLHCWERLLAGLSGEVVPLTAPHSWGRLVTMLCSWIGSLSLLLSQVGLPAMLCD